MKVLIISCNTGGGHNSCAKYIEDELKANNIECCREDFHKIVNTKDLVSKAYLKTLSNDGKMFKNIYALGSLYSKTKVKSPVYLVNKMYAKRLYNYIIDNSYTLVITTHLFPTLTLTSINKKHKDEIPFIFVYTDYEPCPFIEEVKPNYIVINKYLEDKFISKGIKKDTIINTGIPISTSYIDNAKDIRKKLNIHNEKVVLIMLGSMGFGNIESVLNELLKLNTKIIIVCGNNKKLYNKLSQINNDKLIVFGFVSNINDLIASSDIVLSKPGGLSTTEITTLNKPLVHIYPIPGIETHNVEFFEDKKMSIVCYNNEDIITNIKKLLDNDSLREELIKNQKKYINKYSAKDLVDFIKNKYN